MNGVIIQARMGSSRLPGKSLLPILGKPLLQRVFERAAAAELVDVVIVATTDCPEDLAIQRLCEEQGVPCYRGSENDVLDRYYQTAKAHGLMGVLRVTGDCPLVDPELLDDLLREFATGRWDHVCNSLPVHVPHGMEASVASFDAYERSWHEASLASEREHVTQYIRKHPEFFRTTGINYEPDYSSFRITVDHADDFEVVSEIFRLLEEKGQFGHREEVAALFKEYPDLACRNAGHEIGEGLLKSLQSDRVVDHRGR